MFGTSSWQAMQGFKRLSDSLTDLELDVPSARQDFECMKETAEMHGWLPDAGVTQDFSCSSCHPHISGKVVSVFHI